jgi:hypothetical protein
MKPFQFTRIEPQLDECSGPGHIKLIRMAEESEFSIEIATDWQEGVKLVEASKLHFHTGFIARGFTKQGIYVSTIACRFGVQMNNILPG